MQRRLFLQWSLLTALGSRCRGATMSDGFEKADGILNQAATSGQVSSAVLHVEHRGKVLSRAFGQATSPDALFLLGSISKPICLVPLLTLLDRHTIRLEDPVHKFLPRFTREGRDQVTLRHLLTHTSGLPDMVAANNELRRKHAPLGEFVEHALQTPLSFTPGTQYQYSSMGILLTTQVSEQLLGSNILDLVDRTVFQPLKMTHSAQGLGKYPLADMVPCQTEKAAPESGAGDPTAKDWDWNSPYWRQLGAPWGGTHASATDVARFLNEFLPGRNVILSPETALLARTNQNPPELTPRGLGFVVGGSLGGTECSPTTFGHTGSTGTIAWADPATDTICVILTSLPGRAVTSHPRQVASEQISKAIK